MKEYRFDTLQARAGFTRDPATGANIVPIYQTNAYQFENVADAAAQFRLEKPGSIYTRLANPTTAVLEQRIAALEGGVGNVCFASGMAAELAAVQNLAESGTEIIVAATVYGGSYTVFFHRFEQRFGIKVRQVKPDDLEDLKSAINEKTRCIFFESLGNPNINIPDFEAIADIAHENGLPFIVDNTFGSPYLFDAKKHGADFTVHSLTKYIGGHGNSTGGSVTDLGTFSFKNNPRFREFNEVDEAYHGLVYADLGEKGYISKLRAGFLRDTGGCLSPFNSFLILQGLETLSLRMQRHCENAEIITKHLSTHPQVEWINYPGLPGDAYHERAKKYFPKGVGGIFTFGIKGGLEAGKKFIDALELFTLCANVSDVRSLVVHPASTTNSQLNEDQLKRAGVSVETVRVSVGLEDVNDLLEDIEQALAKSKN